MRDDLEFPVGVEALEPLPNMGVVGGIDAEVGSVADVEIKDQVCQSHPPSAYVLCLHLAQK